MNNRSVHPIISVPRKPVRTRINLPIIDDQHLLISISIVTHDHGTMVERLVADLLDFEEVGQIVVTHNLPSLLTLPVDARILVLDNAIPAGFAANHNTAFSHCTLPYFCPLNPDIQFRSNPFPALLAAIQEADAAIAAPLVRNPKGDIENSIRRFPTLHSLLSKALGVSEDDYKTRDFQSSFHPEWIAGMFMLFRSDDFRLLGGFDERFFLYYEDVDICARCWKAGMKVLACPSVSVIHDAQRTSHGNLRYMRWHLASMARYFLTHWGRLPSLPNR